MPINPAPTAYNCGHCTYWISYGEGDFYTSMSLVRGAPVQTWKMRFAKNNLP